MSTRLLSIAADLSAPPSSPSVFRDVTLFASIKGYDVVATVNDPLEIDPYARWFRTYGLWDYLDDLLEESQLMSASVTVTIAGGPGSKLTAHCLHEVLGYL